MFSSAPRYIKMFALDEADEMLSRGFKDQIYEIFQKLSSDIQVNDSLLLNGCSWVYKQKYPVVF